MDWRDRAACLDEDPELFFPIGNTGPAILQIEEAKAVCRRCEVIDTCLKWAHRVRPGRRRLGRPVRGRAPRAQAPQRPRPPRRLTHAPPDSRVPTRPPRRSRCAGRMPARSSGRRPRDERAPASRAAPPASHAIVPRRSCTSDWTIWVPSPEPPG